MSTPIGKLGLAAVVGVLLSLSGLAAGPAAAAPPVAVDFTVAETLDSVPGTVSDATGLPCDESDVVTTTPTSSTTHGSVTQFEGTKTIACDEGALTISYNARVVGCATTTSGTWKVVGGTGVFEGAKGGGQLLGTYTPAGATTCASAEGINDHYTGMIKLAG